MRFVHGMLQYKIGKFGGKGARGMKKLWQGGVQKDSVEKCKPEINSRIQDTRSN